MEGIELMVACLRAARPLRKVAIKLLHFALNEHPRNTGRLLEADGIKYTFGFLMRESKITAEGIFSHYHDDLATDHGKPSFHHRAYFIHHSLLTQPH